MASSRDSFLDLSSRSDIACSRCSSSYPSFIIFLPSYFSFLLNFDDTFIRKGTTFRDIRHVVRSRIG